MGQVALSSSRFLSTSPIVLNLLEVIFETKVGYLIFNFSHWRWLCTFCQLVNRQHAFSSKTVDHQYQRSCSARMERNTINT